MDDRVDERSGSPASLTVVIVSFRCRELLRDCLASLDNEARALGVPVVVVDNDSGDGTAEMVADEFTWVELRSAGANVGFSKANNLVLRDVATEFVLLLNPDTVVPPGGLAAVVDEIGRRPAVGVLGAKLVTSDGTLDHACKRSFPSISSALLYFTRLDRLPGFAGRRRSYVTRSLPDDEPGEVDAVNGAFMLVRTSALAEVGLLDERFWMYGEDLDWCLRFWQHGWTVLYWPGIEVLHVKGATDGGRRSPRANQAFHEAMWLYYEKHHAGDHRRTLNAAVHAGIRARARLHRGRSASRGRGRPTAASLRR